MSETLFTGVFPPSPPPCPQESYPEADPCQDVHSDAGSLDSSISSIPPQSPKKPYSSRLQAQHFALNILPEIIAAPSRETTPESYRRAAKIKGELQATMRRFRVEHRSAELGTAYLGDRTALFCARFARCEWGGPKRKKRRVDAPPVKEVWDVGYGMGLPPLVETEAEWEAWEKTFEARKAEVLAQREVEARRQRRHANRKRTPKPPPPEPAPQQSPVMGLGTRVEMWRNDVLPSSQPGSQLFAPTSQSQAQVQKETPANSGKLSQSSQLSFKIVKKAPPAGVKGKRTAVNPPSPVKRRELPPSVPVHDPLKDILVESSQPELAAIVVVDDNEEVEEDRSPVELHASDRPKALNETQETEESLRIIAAYAADNPAERLRLHHARLTSSQDSAEFSTLQSWSNSYPDDPQFLDTQQEMSLPAPTGRDDMAHPHLAAYSEGSGDIDLDDSAVEAASYYPARPRPPELRLSEIMHCDGDEVMEKDAKDKRARAAAAATASIMVQEPDDRPSFAEVIQSTPVKPPLQQPQDRDWRQESRAQVEEVHRSFVEDSESSRTVHPVEAPSFNGVLTSTQHQDSGEVRDKVAEMEIVPDSQEEVTRKSSPANVPNETSLQNLSFKDVVHSTQTSRDVDPPFTRPAREKQEADGSHSQDAMEQLSFEHVVTSTQAPEIAVSAAFHTEPEIKQVIGKNSSKGQDSPEILVPCSQTMDDINDIPSSSLTPSRKRKRSIEETEMEIIYSKSAPSTPKQLPKILMPSSTLTPPTTPSVREKNYSQGEAARDIYRTPTSAKRVTNLADLVRPNPAGLSTSGSTSPNRLAFADLGRSTPKGSRTPSRGPTIHGFGALGRQNSKTDSKETTPIGPSSPFSTPTSAVRRPIVDHEGSPPSLRKPNMARMAFGAAKTLEPQTSGLFGMDYNSQFQIEENVEEVANFLKNDVWDPDESP